MFVTALSEAIGFTIGIIVTFGGIGLLVNGIIIYAIVGVISERTQNKANAGSGA